MESPYKTFVTGYSLFELIIHREGIADNHIYIVATSIREALTIASEYCSDYLENVHVIKKGYILFQKERKEDEQV